MECVNFTGRLIRKPLPRVTCGVHNQCTVGPSIPTVDLTRHTKLLGRHERSKRTKSEFIIYWNHSASFDRSHVTKESTPRHSASESETGEDLGKHPLAQRVERSPHLYWREDHKWVTSSEQIPQRLWASRLIQDAHEDKANSEQIWAVICIVSGSNECTRDLWAEEVQPVQ